MSSSLFQDCKVLATGVDPRVYHAKPLPRGHKDFVMTRSELMSFYWNPRGWILGSEEKGTKSTEFGSLVNCITLTPKLFFNLVAICPATYTNKKGEQSAWKKDLRNQEIADWYEENEGRLIVKSDANGQAHAAAKRLREDGKIAALLDCSDAEVLVQGTYHDRATDVSIPVKALLDLVPRLGSPFQRCLADLKTARNAAPAGWGRTCFDDDLHVQAAFYTDLYASATGEDRTDWLHVIVENLHPYEPARRLLASDFVSLGREQYIAALQRYCRCLASGYWPGYDDEGDTWNGWGHTYLEPWMSARASGRLVDLPPLPKQDEPEAEKREDDLMP